MAESQTGRLGDWQWSRLQEQGRQFLESEKDCIRERPITSVLSTFAVGFVCGAAIVALSAACQSALSPPEPESRWRRAMTGALPREWRQSLERRFS